MADETPVAGIPGPHERENGSQSLFRGPAIPDGARVAVQLGDGSLRTGYLHDGQIRDKPPVMPPVYWVPEQVWDKVRRLALWRIDQRAGMFVISKRYGDSYEPWCYFNTFDEACGAFATGGLAPLIHSPWELER